MKTTTTLKRWWADLRLVLLACLFGAGVFRTHAQQVSNYVFSATTGTFTPITGGTTFTALSGGNTDDGYWNNIPIGFAFNYAGGVYTSAAACTNGWLSLVGNMTANAWTNNLDGGITAARPVLAPLWDDHDGAGITFKYKSEAISSGTDSVFTAEWLDVDWQFQGNSVISFQVKLFKNSGAIQFIYRQESTPVGFAAASIGITGVGTGAGNFLSLNNATAAPTASSTAETTTISTRPATGQIYQFNPPTPGVPVVSTGAASSITTSQANLSGFVAPGAFPSISTSGIVVGTSANPTIGGFGVVDSTTNPVVGAGSFSKTITGLSTGTTYHYRAYAINSLGTTYGADSTFTTNSSATAPTVSTITASGVGAYNATVGLNITLDGGSPITSSGVVFSTTTNPSVGGLGVIDSTTSPLIITGSYNFNLIGLTPATTYYFRAYATNAVGTSYGIQGSFTTAPVVSNLPYLQNFDSIGNNGWASAIVGGTFNNWVVGTPAKANISAAFSTPNAWITGLTANYNDNHNAALVSPQFDFSSLTANPVLRFKHKFRTEACCDGGILEISINGGAWTKVENTVGTGPNFNTTNGTAWYNSGTQGNSWNNLSTLFSTAVNGWITSSIALPGSAGQSNVKFRFRFITDVSAVDEGWVIDDIEVFAPSAPTVLTGTKANITTNLANLSGTITDNGGSVVTASGFVLSTSPNPVRGGVGVIDTTTVPVVVNGPFNLNAANLTLATTYYYRAYAVNAVGTSYGADSTFTTNAASVVPTVVGLSPINVNTTTAGLRANITSDGGAAVTASGFVYATTNNPLVGGFGVVDSTTTPVVTNGAFNITPAGLTPATKYYFRAYATNSVGTAYGQLDSFFTQPIYTSLPYSENFDSTYTPWTSFSLGLGVNDWQLGTPSKTFISSAYSAPNAWVTKLSGNYSNAVDAYILSPQFDFTNQTADPILRFRHKLSAVASIDGAVVEISTNGGASWIQLDNTVGTGANYNSATSTTWYNNAANGFWTPTIGANFSGSTNGYSTQVNGWVQTTTRLTGAAGQPNVRFRLRFASTTYTFFGTQEGWAVDNIEVFPPTAPTVVTGTYANVTTSAATLGGNITGNGNATITASGIVISTSPNPVRGGFGVIDSATTPLVSAGQFNLNVANLSVATTYYYRAYAVNGVGTSYGADSTFTTNASAVVPTVLRTVATNLQAYSATVGGNITSDGGSAVTASGIVYSTTPNPALFGTGVVDSTTNPVVLTGAFSINPSGLTHSTKYYYRAYATNSVGTAYSVEDSFITSPVISVLPYSQNFDLPGNTGWSSVSTGGTNNWVLGTPTKTFLASANSSPNAWVTKLSGNYDDNVNAAVESPQFDFTNLTAAPILRYKHKFVTEAGWDGLVIEISVNGGAWTKLDNTLGTGTNYNTATSTGWYNSASTAGPVAPPKFSSLVGGTGSNIIYSSQVNGWVTSSTPLTGAFGQSNVKVRFRFASDGSGNDEGWALDDIEVFAPSAPIVTTGTKTNVTSSSATLAGNVINNGGNAVTASGVVVSTSPNPTRATVGVIDSTTNPLVTSGTYTLNLTGLTLSTTYYYRAYAVNALGTSYGADSSFTTPASAVVPTVLNVTASNLTATTATFGGNITSDGGAAVTASGVVYATTSNPVLFGVGVVDSTTTPLVGLGSYSFNAAGLTHSTKYYYRAYATNSAGTAYSVQDSFVTDPIISVLPYTQNFESGRAGWNSMLTSTNTNVNWIIGLATNNNWVLGTPAKVYLSGAKSGTNAWVTKLTGQHDVDHDASVVSPQFNFSGLSSDPIVRFNHKFKCESDWDGMIVEVSINGGYWRRADSTLGTGGNFNTPNSYGWYNNNVTNTGGATVAPYFSTDLGSGSAYSSQTNGWIESAFRLVGAAGQSNVRFRFRFIADGFVSDEGWAIDDIEVVNVTTPTTAASNVNITPSATSANVTFTAGNGQGRMVVARLSSTLAVAPTNNTLYNASSVYGSTNTTGTGNFIVYMGTGTSVNVTGLTALTGYTFDVYEYNGKYMHNSFAGAISSATTTTPVKLVSLKASKVNEGVLVSWTTASELNNRGFNVERSIDGKTFEYVGFVKGAGNSSVTNNYTLEDVDAFTKAGVNKLYYRLKQMDNDGKFEYSQVVTVENDNNLSTEIVTYPNPFSDKLSIAIKGVKAGNANIQVMDISGRLIMSFDRAIEDGSQTITLEGLSGLSQGVYFVRVDASGITEVVKMVKQ
jgi:hypothetical protein